MVSLIIYIKPNDPDNYLMEENLIGGVQYTAKNHLFIEGDLITQYVIRQIPEDVLWGKLRSLSPNICYTFANGYLIYSEEYLSDKFIKISYHYDKYEYTGSTKSYYKRSGGKYQIHDTYSLHNETGAAIVVYNKDDSIKSSEYCLHGSYLTKQKWEEQIATKLYW